VAGSTLVANPMYVDLSNLYTQLQKDASAMSGAMQGPDQQMGQGQTWVGPPARTWGGQLHGYSADCSTQVGNMLAEVQQALQSTPQQVTPQEAQGIRKTMTLIAANQ